ncbi:MAG TPA: ACT domain-containing protein [Clostridia bacterium]|nr:ACT domain-containing protein [Clostridia bacterium]HOL61092.1 ACT domain-containing protein [Clostridia bacterium]HPO53774.1 ACT domain-containing protein [Clostridia bacterium]
MKAFITVIGKDRVGIIAAVSATLANHKINIEDISQTILQGIFTMIMAVDLSECDLSFEEIARILAQKGSELGVEISIRHEAIFQAMHRI